MDFIKEIKEIQSEEKTKQFNEFLSSNPAAEELFSHESFLDLANSNTAKINN